MATPLPFDMNLHDWQSRMRYHCRGSRSLHEQVLRALIKRESDGLLAHLVYIMQHTPVTRPLGMKYAPLAARQAAALNAHRESASHYNTALQHAAALAPEERAALFEGLSYECFLSDQIEDAFSARRNAFEIWESTQQHTKARR